MLPWVYSSYFDLQSTLVFALRCRTEEINMRTLRMWHLAITLMGCTVLNVTAKPAPVLADGANNRESQVTIPATTPLAVKLDQVVSARTVKSGEGFTVTFSEPVRVDGTVVIPAGAAGAGFVSSNSQNGTEMELNSVFVNGRSYRVTTSPIPFNSKSTLRAGTKFTFDLMLSLKVVE
jgi:hypothetical protein